MEVGIIGYSSIISRKVIPSLLKIKEIKCIHIFSRRKIKESDFLKNNSKLKIHSFGNLENFISKSNCFFYYVSTENSTHFDLAYYLLLSRQNVIVDKPITADEKQLIELINLAKLNKCFLAESLTWQYHDQIKLLKSFLIRNKKIQVNARFTIPLPPKNSFRVDKSFGSGVFWDMSSYLCSTAKMLNINSFKSISISRNESQFYPQWMNAKWNNKNLSFDGVYGFGFNYQNQLELICEDEVMVFERIYTTEPNNPAKVFHTTNKNFKTNKIIDDSFYNFFKHVKSMIIEKNYLYEIKNIEELYKIIFNIKTQ